MSEQISTVTIPLNEYLAMKENIRKFEEGFKNGATVSWKTSGMFGSYESFKLLTKDEALKRERQIKNWKSRPMIEKLFSL